MRPKANQSSFPLFGWGSEWPLCYYVIIVSAKQRLDRWAEPIVTGADILLFLHIPENKQKGIFVISGGLVGGSRM